MKNSAASCIIYKNMGYRKGLTALIVFISATLAFYTTYHCVINPGISIDVFRLPSGQLFLMEDSGHTRLRSLHKQEELAIVTADADTDLGKAALLAAWSAKLFPATTPFPRYPPWNAGVILQRIRTGTTGGFCAQYALVFGQACQSMGYYVRYVDLATADTGSSHFITEVYIKNRRKWVAFDPMRGHAYYRNSAPLNSFEIHRYITQNQWDIYSDPGNNSKLPASHLRLFCHFRYYLRNNFLSVPVYVCVKESERGQQWIFEPYRMRWLDEYTADVQESGSSIVSSDKAAFVFALDDRSKHTLTCSSSADFHDVAYTQEPYVVFTIHTRRDVLRRYIESLIDDMSYRQLL